MDARAPILAELRAALEEVLAALGNDGGLSGGIAGSNALEAARVRADSAFLRLRAADAERGASAHPYPEELQDELEGITRLQALLQSVAAGAQVTIADERAKLTAVRKALRQRAREQSTARAGRSCDVRG